MEIGPCETNGFEAYSRPKHRLLLKMQSKEKKETGQTGKWAEQGTRRGGDVRR